MQTDTTASYIPLTGLTDRMVGGTDRNSRVSIEVKMPHLLLVMRMVF